MANMTFGVNLLPNNTGGQKTLGNSNQRWTIYTDDINTTSINGATPVSSVNTQTGDVVITAADLGAYVKPSGGIPDIDIASAMDWSAKQEPMVILSYGTSTWDDFIDAYNKHAVVYCRASSNSNPASGAQTRLAFMAYINANPPTTEVEFQYYRSVSSHSATQMSDQVYVYKLNKTNGWSVTTREASMKQLKTETGLDVAYSSNIATVSPSLVSTTALTNAAVAATEVADRVYPVALDANGKLAVNVPWSGISAISSSDVTTALGYTPYNSSNPNGYTSNVGTITGITMNGASKGTSGVVDLGTVITDVSDKAPVSTTVTNIAYDTTNAKITKTINGTTTDVVSVSTIKSDLALSSSDITGALGYTPYNSTNPNGYTSNVGTITGITMNSMSKGVSGTVDLGTVVTSVNGQSGDVLVSSADTSTFAQLSGADFTGDISTTGTLTVTDTTASSSTSTGAVKISGGLGVAGNIYGANVYGAVWNDYAEYRKQNYKIEPGRVVRDTDNGVVLQTEERLIPGAQIVSDTFGFAIGKTDDCQTPLAVSGRALAYTYQPRENYHAGQAVCSAPNGTIDIMTRAEIQQYPDAIIGIVSEIPDYDTWGTGNVPVNNRIWIKVR